MELKNIRRTGASLKDSAKGNAREWVRKPEVTPWVRKLDQEFDADVSSWQQDVGQQEPGHKWK